MVVPTLWMTGTSLVEINSHRQTQGSNPGCLTSNPRIMHNLCAMPVLVLCFLFFNFHLIASSHIGSWMVEEGDGFPGQAAGDRAGAIRTQAVPACRSLPARMSACLPTMPAICSQAFCCSLLFQHQTTSLSPSALAAISRQPVISLYLPATGCSIHYYTFISHMSLHSVLIGIQFMKGQNWWFMLWFQNICIRNSKNPNQRKIN